MSDATYNYGHIVISHYKFDKLLNLKITKELNHHAKLTIIGIIPEEKIDEYVENASDSQRVKVSVKEDDSSLIVFEGIVTNLAVSAVSNVRSITIEALSETFLMDVTKKNRSFQDKNSTYSEVFKQITGDYPNSDVVDEASKGKTLGGLLVQYKETDWSFIKRLASHFNAPLIPAAGYEGLKYFIGVPNLGKKYTLEEFNYCIKKDLKGYKEKSKNDLKDIKEEDLISYEITSNKILELCSKVEFKSKSLYVFKADIEMEDGILSNKYILTDMKGLLKSKIYNQLLVGVSLFGKVLEVSKDTVKVHLEIDKKQPVGTAMWFPYSTVYSSPDGSGWYCMPEIGDQVRVYLPEENERNAIASSSVNLNSSDSNKRSNPAIKSIGTKYGKQILFKPGAIEIIGNGKLLMRLTDEGGIEINSNKKITLSAKDDIEINGGAKILIQGEEGIDLKQAGTSLNIKDNVTLSGGKVNIQ